MLSLSNRRRLSLVHNALLLLVASAALLGGAYGLHQQTKRGPVAVPPPASSVPVQREPARETDHINRPTSAPYAGTLSIFEDPKRDEKLQIERVMDALKMRPGVSVADIGAGSGWFTVRAARRIGGDGLVYAVEINEDYLKHISDRATKENLPNIRTVKGLEDDPRLPPNSVEVILLLKTYHEIGQPIRLLRNARRALRSGGLLGVIDRNGTGDDHGLDRDQVVSETERAGFALVAEHNELVKGDDMDYFLIFRAK